MKFVEIDFMSAMQMLEDGEIKSLYFWIGESVQAVKHYKSDYALLKTTRYFKKIDAQLTDDAKGWIQLKYQISKESYDYFRGIEQARWCKLKDALLLQVSELNGKHVIFHVTEVSQEGNTFMMDADIKASFKTEAEAQMRIRNMKRDVEMKIGVRPL